MEKVLPRSRPASSLASRWPGGWRRKRGVTGVFCAAARRRETRKRARMVLNTYLPDSTGHGQTKRVLLSCRNLCARALVERVDLTLRGAAWLMNRALLDP
ncbi:predicted protein [Verticillium alfalfae VaMs.102]|uniref:Predicted protein n=1 Tax=Verticillium alfalfae (strain VaMs.102 / ATCC MYA-4576 / FGSC 10136) TaxID=526221 RepID=C9SE72_VERA1|nr:predicted protein [Verticillium alfalfae VaMs.102]EEY16481.1 predicted protein [Verticillium alfalfae VaMs.102]